MRRLLLLLACMACATVPARPVNPELRALFERRVEPIVAYRCAGCHGSGGCCSKFLAPDMYTHLKSWPHLLGPTPARSLLVTKGDHQGPAFPPKEAKVIEQWIRAENQVR